VTCLLLQNQNHVSPNDRVLLREVLPTVQGPHQACKHGQRVRSVLLQDVVELGKLAGNNGNPDTAANTAALILMFVPKRLLDGIEVWRS
jgi:hypothetical protein